MIRAGHVREHTAHGPQGGTYKVLTLTGQGVERAERIARDQGLASTEGMERACEARRAST